MSLALGALSLPLPVPGAYLSVPGRLLLPRRSVRGRFWRQVRSNQNPELLFLLYMPCACDFAGMQDIGTGRNVSHPCAFTVDTGRPSTDTNVISHNSEHGRKPTHFDTGLNHS